MVVEKVNLEVKDFKPGYRVVIPSAGTNWLISMIQREKGKEEEEEEKKAKFIFKQ